MSSVAATCQHPGCDVTVSGVCALKRDPVESCPNFPASDTDLDSEIDADSTDSSTSHTAALETIFSSEKMLIEDLRKFSNERVIRPIALIGEEGAGKTTLLASIFGMFCKGPVGGMTFAGSRTLRGFAKLHHSALLTSGKKSPSVPRTSRNDPLAFFHLSLSDQSNRIVDLIISDRSGEIYAAARTDTNRIATLIEMEISERICFLLDGDRLASDETRAAYARQFKQMIHALHDNGALDSSKKIEIVSTKFDVTNARGQSDQHTKFLDEYEAKVKNELAEKKISVDCYRVCALPKTDVNVGFKGLDELVLRWSKQAEPIRLTLAGLNDTPRQMDRYLSRVENGAA